MITVPRILKAAWAEAVLLADKEVPILANMAVIQVPILSPKSIGMAASIVINLLLARAISKPMVALLLWMIMVINTPPSTPKMGPNSVPSLLPMKTNILAID